MVMMEGDDVSRDLEERFLDEGANLGNNASASSSQQQQQQPNEVHGTSEFTRKYINVLRKRKYVVLVFWFVMFCLGGILAPKFMEAVILVFEPPPGTPGHEADKKLKEEFPGISHEADTIVLINTKDKITPILGYNNDTKPFIRELTNATKTWGLEKANPKTTFVTVDYFMLETLGAHFTANSLLDNSTNPESATAMLLSIHLESGFEQGSMEGNHFADWLDKEISKLHKKYLSNDISVAASGMLQFCRDMQEGSEKDMMTTDSFSFPFSLFILAYMLKSARMLLITFVNIAVTISFAMAIMYPVSQATVVIAVTPSVMMSISLAFSLDYSLFLLSRYREEVSKGSSVPEAVVLMVDSAGHTILVSGGIIAVCWLGLVLFPVTLLSTIGLGAGLTVIIALCVNITLIPAMLLTFDKFFSNFENYGLPKKCTACCNKKQDDSMEHQEGLVRNDSIVSVESPCTFDAFGRRPIDSARSPIGGFATPGSVGSGAVRTPVLERDGSIRGEISNPVFGLVDPLAEIDFLAEHSVWYKCGDRLFGTPLKAVACVVVLVALILPLSPYAVDFHHSESFKLFTPSDSKATKAALTMEDLYGGGRIAPYELLIEPPEGVRVLSNHFFQHVQGVLTNNVLGLDYGSNRPVALMKEGITGMMMLNGVNVSFTPFGDFPHQTSIAKCALEVGTEIVEAFLGVCASDKCAAEMDQCEKDAACGDEINCLSQCGNNLTCYAGCLSRVSDWDSAGLALGECVVKSCLLNQTNSGSGRELLLRASDDDMVPDCPSVMLQFAQSINGFRPKSTWVMLNLHIDPYSQDGTDWLDAMRDEFKRLHKLDGYNYYLSGGDVPGHDTVNKVFDLFPLILCIILVAVFLIVGVSFRSIFLPFRAIFTITLSLILVYGTGVLVYEHGALEWLGWSALKNPIGDSLTWLVPAMAAPICVGFGLDYDVFLLTRIYEYRGVGFKTRDSIFCGLAQTGGIITSAGAIMFFAFFGLLMSDNPSLNQLSLFLCVSVLADTFIIRTIIVPSVMLIVDHYVHENGNWFPWKPATLDY